MLTLITPLKLDVAAMRSPNLCDRFDPTDLQNIGIECAAGYDQDEASRATWVKRNEAGMDLALQIQKDKTFPWPGCANVAFPLVTIAAMQFHARAYPAIVNGTDIVKSEVFGLDPTGELTARGERISTHMSWQLIYQDTPWEEQEDKSLLNVSIVGTNFKKSYNSASLGHNVSELVLAKDLVLNYWAKSVESCPRKTHNIPMQRNDIHEKVMRGVYRDCLEEPWYESNPVAARGVAKTNQDNRQGVTPPQPDFTSPFIIREQHVNLDLDDDGYAEPYIITFEANQKYVLRIVTRFEGEASIERVALGPHKGKIIKITSTEYFTKRPFIPSPDGGIYDLGFGVFLGPLNEAVNSLINMLLDAGTMQTTAGGFLGRGAKIRGGIYTIAPFEWKRVDSTGDDLRKSIFPLPINQPSDVLFQLLGLLITYGSQIAGTTETQVGENPGQNTPAQTMQTMREMGEKVYTAIFKRIWRSSKEEFRKLFKLNGIYLPLDKPQVGGATREDYMQGEDQIRPVADPTITSDSTKLQHAIAIKQSAATTPGYNLDEVERRFLRALHVDGIDAIFRGTEGQPPPKDPKVALEEVKTQGKLALQERDLQARMFEFVTNLQEERILNNAKVTELEAKAAESAANAQNEEAYAQVAMINAEISRVKLANESIMKKIDQMIKAAKIRSDHEIGLLDIRTQENGESFMSQVLTEGEFNDWLQHPVTIAVRDILAAKRERMRQDWEGGSFTDYDNTAMALVNVGNIGTCRGYAFIQELDYEGYLTEVVDEQSVGARPEGSSSTGETV